MIIDSHQHFWKYDPSVFEWITDEMQVLKRDFTPDDLSALLNQNGITGCVAVQVEQSEKETEFLLALANRHDFIKGVVGWIDLKNRDLEKRLEYFSQFKKLKGFRHIVQSEPRGFLLDNQFIYGVRKLTRFNFTYDLLIYHHQLDEALIFLSKTSDVKIVIDHMAKPSVRTGELNVWKSNLTLAASFKNVYCKMSGMVTEADWKGWKTENFLPYLNAIFEIFGPHRIMYGSDWPVCLLAAKYHEQFATIQHYIANISNEEKMLVMGDNAKIFYNL